jgi:hypothetical protein
MENHAAEQTLSARAGEYGTAGVTKDHHLTRISAELSDIVTHPFQGPDLIHVAVVAGAPVAASL